jgi:hypothetical protein
MGNLLILTLFARFVRSCAGGQKIPVKGTMRSMVNL